MTRITTLILIFCCWGVSYGQTDPQTASRTEEIRSAVDKLWQSGEAQVIGVLYDMRTFEGKVIHVDDETFSVYSKKKSGPGLMPIKFKQVLELNGKGVSISYFPDPDLSPFADWNALKKLTHGDTLDIDLTAGGSITAVLLRVSDAGLTLMDGNRTKDIKQDEVQRIFLARRETHSIGKALKGAGKGAGSVGRGPGRNAPIGAAAVHGAVLMGATAAGAVSAVARRSPNDRLLLYAK